MNKLLTLLLYLSGVKKSNGAIQYLVKWNDQQMLEIVNSKDAIRKLPILIIFFLEAKLEWISLNDSSSMSRSRPVECDSIEIEDVEPLYAHCKYYVVL